MPDFPALKNDLILRAARGACLRISISARDLLLRRRRDDRARAGVDNAPGRQISARFAAPAHCRRGLTRPTRRVPQAARVARVLRDLPHTRARNRSNTPAPTTVLGTPRRSNHLLRHPRRPTSQDACELSPLPPRLVVVLISDTHRRYSREYLLKSLEVCRSSAPTTD